MPRLSVLMAVHNGEPWIVESLESILHQTFGDFEFLVVDDGSTDGAGRILDGIEDKRLKVLHDRHAGLTRSLNRALRLVTAPLLARMDADDIALPDRFARQMAFLDEHPEIGILGTGCHEIDPEGRVLRTILPPADDLSIRRALIRRNPFIHGTMMVRRQVLDKVGLYDERLPVAQDYDLWLRLSRVTQMANLAEPLLLRRLSFGMISRTRDTERLMTELRVKLRALRSGGYPAWCAVYLLKPLVALAVPAGLRGLLRRGAALS